MRKQQTMTLTVTTKGDGHPVAIVREALSDSPSVAEVRVTSSEAMMEVRGPNRERLVKLAVWAAGEHAKQELGLPSEWDQSDWMRRSPGVNACGTTCCIAGKVAVEDGAKPLIEYGEWTAAEAGQTTARAIIDGEVVNIEMYAMDALGLDMSQAQELFRGSNDLDDVLRVIRELLAETDADEDEQVAPQVQAERRPIRTAPCEELDCSLCYEDVPAEQPAF